MLVKLGVYVSVSVSCSKNSKLLFIYELGHKWYYPQTLQYKKLSINIRTARVPVNIFNCVEYLRKKSKYML